MSFYIHYQYRDASNYKNHGSLSLTRMPTTGELETILGSLDAGSYFIPCDADLDDLYFDTHDDDLDHPWHELLLDPTQGLEGIDTAPSGPVDGPYDPAVLAAKFEAANVAGWPSQYDDTAQDI